MDFKFLEPFNFEFKHSMRMWDKKEMLGNYRFVKGQSEQCDQINNLEFN